MNISDRLFGQREQKLRGNSQSDRRYLRAPPRLASAEGVLEGFGKFRLEHCPYRYIFVCAGTAVFNGYTADKRYIILLHRKIEGIRDLRFYTDILVHNSFSFHIQKDDIRPLQIIESLQELFYSL